jgi:hypothetical protein
MKKQILKKIMALTLIFSYLFIILGDGGNLVLCIGQEGHISIELASDTCCKFSDNHSSYDSQVSKILKSKVSNTDECSCIDIPITIHLKNKRDIPKQTKNTYLLSQIEVYQNCSVKAVLPVSFSPQNDSTLKSIRSVVLLI